MVANSSYLDFTSYGTIPASVTDPATAYGLTNTQPVTGNAHITVAVVLNRANDPTALLNADWGTRQATLAQMQANGTLWTTYGADTGTFNNVKTQLGESARCSGTRPAPAAMSPRRPRAPSGCRWMRRASRPCSAPR